MSTKHNNPSKPPQSSSAAADEFEEQRYELNIRVQTHYSVEESIPEAKHFVFSYTIQIENQGANAAQLISRSWTITDANGKVDEVRGLGVVGQQPYLDAGQSFEYTSYAVLGTPCGSMSGSYFFISDDGFRFDAPIPEFSLVKPNSLH